VDRIRTRGSWSKCNACAGRAVSVALACFLAAPFVATAGAQDPPQEPSQETPQEPGQTEAPKAATGPLVTVHGVVRNAASGEPLPRALVRIEGDSATGALTDGDGRFEIAGLAPGQQQFEVVKPGYAEDRTSSLGVLTTFEEPSAGHNVIVAAEMPELVFTLSPTNAIRGHVELSSGDPAQSIQVMLVKQMVQDGRSAWQIANATKTQSDGTYRFGGLPDGVYALFTFPAMDSEPVTNLVAPGRGKNVPRDGYASVFYPDARDLAGAAKIRLSRGEQVQANFNLTLEPFYAVTASIATNGERGVNGGGADRSGANYSAEIRDGQGHLQSYTPQYDQSTQSVQVFLPDGNYSLMLTGASRLRTVRVLPGNVVQMVGDNTGPQVGMIDFAVAGHAVSNLRVPLTTPRPSAVQFTLNRSGSAAPQPGGSAQGSIVVTASDAGGLMTDGMSSNFATGDGPGALETQYLPPGPYWLHTHFGQKNMCESSFTAGGANLAREPLALSLSGATAPLELTARDDCAKLTLSLPPSLAGVTLGEEPFLTVYVVPDFDSTVDVEPFTMRPTSGTTFTVEGLTPGSYHVYAFTSPVALEYRNRDVMAALPDPGQAVTLSPGATGSLVLEAPTH
jgi:hypothetical protein